MALGNVCANEARSSGCGDRYHTGCLPKTVLLPALSLVLGCLASMVAVLRRPALLLADVPRTL
jgi:hypothetical protein